MSTTRSIREEVAREAFDEYAERATGEALRAVSLETVQVNVGLACNLSCTHCHVESSPLRRERMDWTTMLAVLDLAQRAGASTIDLTGGAPEMHPRFRELVSLARERGFAVIVRTNLTILLRPAFVDLPGFLAARKVRLVASLPCYLQESVDHQRGSHVFADSILALRRLNELGYGVDQELALDLVYNPRGPSLPPPQVELEEQYRRHLRERWGVEFSRLLTITNMPIGRFLEDLRESGRKSEYQAMLREHSAPANVDRVMCRRQIHVSHDGTLHDCDFNYALGLGLADGAPRTIGDLDPGLLRERRVRTGEHCFGCTAGHGSSCGGALR